MMAAVGLRTQQVTITNPASPADQQTQTGTVVAVTSTAATRRAGVYRCNGSTARQVVDLLSFPLMLGGRFKCKRLKRWWRTV